MADGLRLVSQTIDYTADPDVTFAVGGLVALIAVTYSGAPSGTDVTLIADGVTIRTLTDSNTNTAFSPGVLLLDADGATIGSSPRSINDLRVVVAQGDGDTLVTVSCHVY